MKGGFCVEYVSQDFPVKRIAFKKYKEVCYEFTNKQ